MDAPQLAMIAHTHRQIGSASEWSNLDEVEAAWHGFTEALAHPFHRSSGFWTSDAWVRLL